MYSNFNFQILEISSVFLNITMVMIIYNKSINNLRKYNNKYRDIGI